MENNENIIALIYRSIEKDEKAFTTLIQLIQNDLYRIAQARLNDIDDINDAIQETIIIAFRSIKQLHYPEYFKTWIIKILINECNKIYRKNIKQSSIFSKLMKTNKENENKTSEIDNVENKLEVEQLLKQLNYEEKLCITLFYNSNFTLNEIAKILNTNPNTIKSRIFRAKEKIKKTYNGGVENEPAKK